MTRRKTEDREEKKEILNPQDFYSKLQLPELQKFYEKYGKLKFYKILMSNGQKYLCSKREMFLHREYKVLRWNDIYGFSIVVGEDGKGEAYSRAVYDWETYEEYESKRNYAVGKENEALDSYHKNILESRKNDIVKLNDFSDIPEKPLQGNV